MITIVPPLGACSDRIRVRGQKTGSIFTVSAGLEGAIPEELFRGPASGPDQIVVLTRRLKADERVFAGDGSPGAGYAEVVQPEPDQTEVGPVNADAHLHAWGRCGAFGNCLPGAEVTVTSQTRGTLGRGAFDPETGSARVRFSLPLHEGEVLFAEQAICGLTGPPGELPLPDRAQIVDGLLPAPLIAIPPVACDLAVLVKGVAEGATVRMFRGGREYSSACFDYPSAWFQFADCLVTGEQIWFDQRFPDCELHSPPSPPIDVSDPDDLSKPAILGILCPGMPEIGVGQLRFGATVTLIQVHHPSDTIQGGAASQIGDIDAWDTACSVPLYERLNPTRGKFVRAVQTFCNGISFHSEAKEIKPRSTSKPVIVGPLFDCARAVRVVEILPGARVEIYQLRKNRDAWRMLVASRSIVLQRISNLTGGNFKF